MKKIEAVILLSRLDAVRVELERHGIHAPLTLTEVEYTEDRKASIVGKQEAAKSLRDRLKLELIVGDRQAQKAMDVIMEYAQGAPHGEAAHVALLRVREALQIVPPLSII